MDSRKKANLCYKCGEDWTPEHPDVCKMQNIGLTKLSMIIELFDDEDLVDATTALDASYDEAMDTNDSDEALDTIAMKRSDFPFDPEW